MYSIMGRNTCRACLADYNSSTVVSKDVKHVLSVCARREEGLNAGKTLFVATAATWWCTDESNSTAGQLGRIISSADPASFSISQKMSDLYWSFADGSIHSVGQSGCCMPCEAKKLLLLVHTLAPRLRSRDPVYIENEEHAKKLKR